MKKVFRILVIALGVILLLLILTPVIFRSRIEEVVKEKVNSQVQARVDWSGFSLTFFRGFPDLSINLHQVSVVGEGSFEGDTLAGFQRFELRVNPLGALRKNIVVRSILVEHPLVNGIILEDGEVNWDIAKGTSGEEEAVEEEKGTSGSSMNVSLKRFAITGGRVYYSDRSSDLTASLEGFSMEMRGDLSLEQTELKVSSEIERMNMKVGGTRYLKDGVLNLDMLLAANMLENSYTVKENLITLNGLSLGVEGDVVLKDEGALELDLKYFSRETTFKTLLSMVPAVYLQDFNALKTGGTMQLSGTISGIMQDSIMPDATMNLQVKDGYFSYPDLPKDVSDVQILVNVDYRGADMDASRIDVERFHMLLGGNPFELSLKVDHPVSDMHVSGSAEGVIDFASIKDIVPMEDVSLDGRLETDLEWDTKMSYIEQEQYELVNMKGSVQVEGMSFEAPDIPVPVIIEEMNMLFSPRIVELTTLDAMMGSSDLHMDGQLEHFIPYVFKGETMSGRLNVSSNLLDANELLPAEDASETEAVSDTLVPVPPDSLAKPFNIKIPENIDFTTSLDMQRVEYEHVILENIKGNIRIIEGVAGLDQLHMDMIKGSMTTSGWVDTRGRFAEVDVSVDMKNVDIPSATESFVSLGRLAPMAGYCRGSANVEMQYHSFIDQTLTPLFESIDASGHVFTRGLQFYNLDKFISFSELLKNEKFNEMAPDEVNLRFTVLDGRVNFPPFQMDFEHSRMNVSGSHGIDLTMDYSMDMQIAKADLGAGANEMMQGISLLAAGAGLNIPQSDYIKVKVNIAGTFNHPKVTTDLSENLRSAGETIQSAVEEKITGEVEKVEEQVRDEAGERAEQIIADAEAEAARLMDEAEKAGEALVKEAELQGNRLMEEAGNNPVKQVAARTAAGELKRQAEKQSETLVNEAKVKAGGIIQKARDEAEKL